jgi:dTDP-4-amino-4,6-dideoxygalactose transaminase
MTEMQAAFGMSQLKRLDKFKGKRRYIVSLYRKAFLDNSMVTSLEEKDFSDTCFCLCHALIDYEKFGINKKVCE